MSFRSETHQRFVRSCASTWLREHHVCEKCWKSETNSLTELIVTDPDVFFPHVLWKCFNNFKKEKNLGGCFGLVFRSVLLWRCCSGSRNTSDLGRNSFQTSSFSACAHGRGGTLLPGRFSRPPFFPSLPRWNIRRWKSICQRYKRTISASRNHFITSLCFRFNLKFQWRCVTYHRLSKVPNYQRFNDFILYRRSLFESATVRFIELN